MATTTFVEIPAFRKDEFVALCKKINLKKLKYGMALGHYKEIETVSKNVKFRTHIKNDCFRNDVEYTCKVDFVKFELTNMDIVKKDDAEEYHHIGIMVKNDGVISVYCADEKYIDWFKTFPTTCDHCGTNRQRNYYFVFEKDGKRYNIGKTCVKDYFGFDATSLLNLRVKTFNLIYNTDYDIDDMKEYLYINFNKAVEIVSKMKLWDDYNELDTIELFQHPGDSNTDVNLYNQVKDMYASQYNGFAINAFNALQRDYCTPANCKMYLCAIFYALKKIKANQPKKNNALLHNYNVGDRITVKVTVKDMKDFVNEILWAHKRTVTTLIKMVGEDGEPYETFCSGDMKDCIKVGDTVEIKGTIKELVDFHGIKSWKLTRCKMA